MYSKSLKIYDEIKDKQGLANTYLNIGNAFFDKGVYEKALSNYLKSLKISIVVRRCFGGAYCMMNPKVSGGDIIYAYPGAMIGIMSDKAMGTVFKTCCEGHSVPLGFTGRCQRCSTCRKRY